MLFNISYTCGDAAHYVANLTSSYTDKSNETSMVSASVIMFVLVGLFFNLNLFSHFSDVSAILDPKVRVFLSSALSLFLPVMSYLFSEAKNAGTISPGAAKDLSLRAGLILAWMLLVELLRKKVDEIRMRGYSATIQRAGRVVWLGSLVFFNIRSAGRKAVFGVLWILCATKVVQRIAFTEVGKRSYVHGKNARVITSYMAKILEKDRQEHHTTTDVVKDRQDTAHDDVERAVLVQGGGGHELLKNCKYIVMGEDRLVKEATADGYELNEITDGDSIVTVGKVWKLSERDQLFHMLDGHERLRRLCLSFALFKLLRRRFEHTAEMTDEEEARDCRDLIFRGLYNDGERTTQAEAEAEAKAEALFQVMNDEVNFLCEYYHSVIPVVLADPFFFLANYLLLPIVVFGLCLMTLILCGNGDLSYAFRSITEDNYTLQLGITKLTMCLLTKVAKSPGAFFAMVDLSITFLLFIIFFYEEVWEFLVFLLSNWFVVSLLSNYTTRPRWRGSPTFSALFRRILWLRSKMSLTNLTFKQFSVLNLRWPLCLGLPSTLSLIVRTVSVPIKVKHSIMEHLVAHGHGGVPLSNGRSALEKNNLSGRLSWACRSESVAEVILTWHIATSLFEVNCPPQSKEEAAFSTVATRLSKYCAYLVAFHPELLPDNQDKTERVFEAMKKELKDKLGCGEYYLTRRRTRVDKIMRAAGVERWAEKETVKNGATLAKSLAEEAESGRSGLVAVWKLLADVWTELIVYVAPSSDEERVKGHENVLVQGGEFVTVLWALTLHTGISRPASKPTNQHPQR